MRGCVSNRSRPPTRTSRKTPCFMCFFEQDRCHARVTRRIDAASVRNLRPRPLAVVPGNGRKQNDKGVVITKNSDKVSLQQKLPHKRVSRTSSQQYSPTNPSTPTIIHREHTTIRIQKRRS